MAQAKEIRSKIASIKSTQKITKAMEMISASKIRKAQDRMLKARPYAKHIRTVIAHVANSHSEYRHPYLTHREIKRTGLIVITSDRGQCGSLNALVLRTALRQMKQWRDQKIETDLCLIGNKAQQFFKRISCNIVAKASHLGESPSVEQLIGSVKVMLDAFKNGEIDALYVVSNQFVSTMSQKPRMLPLLPLLAVEEEKKSETYWDYIYEPDAKQIIDLLLDRYIESQVYQSLIENIASEHAARMVAMKNATDNAGKIVKELQLIYNKARQAAITQELSEIVAGASAV